MHLVAGLFLVGFFGASLIRAQLTPLTDANPPSTLLPPGTTSLAFSVRSLENASCGYSLGRALPLEQMVPFDEGQGDRLHKTVIRGLDPDTTKVNEVFVRCSSAPDFVLHLRYRSLPAVQPSFPRTGNLWGTRQIYGPGKPLERAARIDLHLGASFQPEEIRRLRELNPEILILTSINVVENSNLPEDYYLHDAQGNRIEVWPKIYRLNLTKKYVAEYQARFAYERILKLDLMVDGCFFDNFFTSQSWLRADIHGRPVQLDADGDGKPDDPKWLDAAWREGVFHELRTWRALMPHALAVGHLPRPADADTMAIFNGDSIGFWTARVLEKERSFADFWKIYHGWFERGRKPVTMMIESAPPNQIAYGYDYSPLRNIPPSTLEFARTYFPYVRFGLAFTLMNDGYFCHEFGDTWHGNDWWYEELDFNLGLPLGAAREVQEGAWRRDFSHGTVLLNGTWQRQTITVGPGFRRLEGKEAARYEYIVDDVPPAFAFAGPWERVVYDSGRWKSKGPFYHNWGEAAHRLSAGSGVAEWRLGIPEDDRYTIAAWWPAAPESSAWTRRATFEVVCGNQVLVSRTLDQSRDGDQWHEIGTAALRVACSPVVRLRNSGEGVLVADALWVRSASRYNDGRPATEVTLEPMDGIILERIPGPGSARVTYEPSDENFPNPERGFYIQEAYRPDVLRTAPLEEGRLRKARDSGISLIRMYYVLSEFRAAPLSGAMLARIASDFATIRKAGLKVIPRFAYNFGPIGAPDADGERILGHLDQLAPLLRENADVIAFLEAGFIGTWGEWHHSTNGLFDRVPGRWWERVNEKSRAIVEKLLQILPQERMIALRYPRHKWDLFGPEPISEAEAYSGTAKARVGAHNDCFLASANDRGTYTDKVDLEKQFLHRDNLFVPQGGETCSAGPDAQPYIGCENALRELEELRYTTLNIGYHKQVLQGWRDQGCMREIERRLGYRFRLLDSEVSVAGDRLRLRFRVANDGFGNLYNPRPLEVVLRSKSGGETIHLRTTEDPRRWMPGRVTGVRLTLRVPQTVKAGDYEVLLFLPDASERLRGRPEYAIRLANQGVWEPATGMNRLAHVIAIRR